jgi:surface polysaccharide O-acyltransferase-like enzyme
MTNRSFLIWLSVLAVPVLALVATQVDTSKGSSIGGGGYDLGPFLYSWLVVIVVGLWTLCALMAVVLRQNRTSATRAYLLIAIGFLTLAAVFLFYRQNLY